MVTVFEKRVKIATATTTIVPASMRAATEAPVNFCQGKRARSCTTRAAILIKTDQLQVVRFVARLLDRAMWPKPATGLP